MHVQRSPHWNVVLRGDSAEVEKAQGRLLEIMEGISYREVFLDNTIFGAGTSKKEIEMKQTKMGQLKQQLMSLKVLDRVIEDTEVNRYGLEIFNGENSKGFFPMINENEEQSCFFETFCCGLL